MSPANGSLRGSRRGWPSMIVSSSTPSPFSQVAASHATTPPPQITIRFGMVWMLVTSREVQGLAASKPSMFGIAGDEPVSRTTAWRAVMVRVLPSGLVTSTVFGPSERTPAPDDVDPVVHAPLNLRGVVEMVDDGVAAGEHGVDVQTASRAAPASLPGRWRPISRISTGRSSPLLGIQAQYEHSPPTSASSTITVSRPESWLAYWAAFSPAAAPPMTMTSHSERSGSTEAATRAR